VHGRASGRRIKGRACAPAMWFVPTLQDMRCILALVLLTAMSELCSYLFIMERSPNSKVERFQISLLLYGSAQSCIGFIGGFYIAKLIYSPPHDGVYCFVKSDEDIMEI
jgi:hypothetical protein